MDDAVQAIKIDDSAAIEASLQRGLDVNYVDDEGNSLLMIAAREGSRQAAITLINAGARVHFANRNGDTALLLASFAGHEMIVDMLAAKGASLGGNKFGWTPLMYAAFAGHTSLVKRFLGLGVNLNAANAAGMTALMAAAMNGYADIARLLLDQGADTALADSYGKTAMDWALTGANTRIADLIEAANQRKAASAKPNANTAPVAVPPPAR